MRKTGELSLTVWDGHQLQKFGHETWLSRPEVDSALFQEISVPETDNNFPPF